MGRQRALVYWSIGILADRERVSDCVTQKEEEEEEERGETRDEQL